MMKKCGKRFISAVLVFAMVFTMTAAPISENAAGFGASVVYADTSEITWTGEDGVTYTFDTSTGTITDASITSPTDVVIPSEIDGVAVVAINNSGFYENGNVISVTFPSSVETIADYTFGLCENLTTVVFETSEETVTDEDGNETTVLKGIKSIGEGVFWRCYGITSVTLPETLESIADQLFSECTSLAQITIPDSVQEIGVCSFWGTGLTEVTIPDTVKTIGVSAFAECTSLETVTIEEGVETIGDCAFYECTALTDVNMPDTMTAIDSAAFTLCTSLTSFVVPEGVTTLLGVFDQCSSLVSVSLPDSLEEVNNYTFLNCPSLEEIVIPDNVTYIGEHAFNGDTSLKSVTLGESVETIEGCAFLYCSSLTELVIPDSTIYIGENAFKGCASLTSLKLGNSLEEIDDWAFLLCSSISELVLPDSLKSVGYGSFQDCSSLKTLELNDGLITISDYAFAYCSSLEELVWSDTVETIGNYAFYKCKNISEVTIPSSAISIGDRAFGECITDDWEKGLTDVYVLSSNVEFGTDVFLWDSNSLTIYGYANSTAQTYAEANNHSFTDLETMYRDLSVTVCDPDGNVITDGYTITWYDENGSAAFDSVWQVESVYFRDSYTVKVVLDDEMVEYYVQPDTITFTEGSDASVVVTLTEVNWFTLTGQVLDASGNGISGTAVTVTHSLLGKTYSGETDAAGTFSVLVSAANVSLKFQKDGYYSHTESLDLSDVTASSYAYGTYSLAAVAADRVVLTVTLTEAAQDGTEAATTALTSLARYEVSVTDESGNAISGYELQGTNVVFADNTVSAGQTLLISIHDPNGNYQDSGVVSVTLDNSGVGTASLTMTQKGGFTFSSLDGPAKCSMSVIGSDGAVCLSGTLSMGTVYSGLDAGDYTVLLIQKSNLIRTVSSEEYLISLGLTEGTDYRKITFTVSDGVITSLEGYEVPTLDESKITYTTDSSITTSKSSAMTVGASFTVRVAYDLDTSKSVDAVSLNVVFPEGVDPTSPQMALVNGKSAAYTYDSSTRTATFAVSGVDSGVVTFYCTAGGTAGTYDMNVYLSLSGNILQPLGSARAVVQDSSISVPSQNSTGTIIASGVTAPYAKVTLYDNDTYVTETTANAVGSWSTEMALAGKLYSYSYHYVYAVVEADTFENGSAMTDEALVIYDATEKAIEVKKVTMYNFGHTQQITEFDFTSSSTRVPYYDYNPNNPTFTFQAEIEMSEDIRALVEHMYAYTVDQYGDRTYVELTYDESTRLWIGSHDYTDSYRIPASVGVAYDMDESWYMMPVDEEWLEDMSVAYEEVYDLASDYMNDLYENYIEEEYDEDTGISSVYYTDEDTGEHTLLYTYVHYCAEMPEVFTTEYLQEIGFSALDEDEVCWFYEEEYAGDNLEGHAVCVVNRAAEEVHVISYDYSNLYEEEETVVYADGYSLSSLDASFSDVQMDSSLELLTVTSASLGSGSSSTQYKIPESVTDNITLSDIQDGDFVIVNGVAYDAMSIAFADIAKEAGHQMELGKQLASSGLARTFQICAGLTAIASQASTVNEFNSLQNNLSTRVSILYAALDNAYSLALAKCEDGTYKLSSAQIEEAANTVSSLRDQVSSIQFVKTGNLLGATAINVIGCIPGATVMRLSVGTLFTLATTGASVAYTGSTKNFFVQQMETDYKESCAQFNEIQSSICALINEIKSEYQDCDEDEEDENPADPDNETPEKKANGNIDPSGYVYEAVPSNTVEGVTAVIYYKDDDGNAVVWDAEDYNQINYQVTDASGIYQWFVPTGEWKVVFTKDGYETADTSTVDAANEDGWLPVPPPQMDIAVGLVSTEAPTVESVTAYTDRIEVVFSQYMDMESTSTANVLNAITMTRDGKAVNVTVTALDAEYNLEGTTQYATRFMIVPTDGNLEGDLVVTIAAAAENYAGTAMGQKYTSETLTPVVRPTGIDAADTVEAVVHETTSIAVTLLPGVAGRTLTVTSSSDSIVSVSTASVTTDEDGNATVSVVANLPGEATVTVTEPISGVSTTITVNSVLTATEEVVVQPVKAYLADGTEVTTGMEIPSGSVITLVTETDGATIRYTVNDTCPCKDAALYYTEPITITEDTVLRAAACVDGVYSTTIRLELTVADSGSGSGDSGSSSGDSSSGSSDSGSSSGSSTTKKSQTLTAKAGSTSLVKGSTTTITASTTGNGKITYSSSNTSVAKVSSSGKITAVGKGTATITVTAAATSTYKKATKTIKVTVKLLSTPKISSIKNTSSGVKLSWSKVTNAEKYAIYRKTSSGSWTKLGTTTSSSYTDTKASAGTLYQYRIICVTKSGSTTTSAYSATKKIVRMKTPSVKSITNTSSGVKLTWSKVTGATKYVIYRKEGSGFWKKLTTTTNLNYTDKKASAGKTYQYKIYSTVTKSSTTYKSAYSTAKKIVRMKTPSIKSITNTSSGVKLTWGKVTGATKYVIYRKEGSGSWKKLTTTTKLTYTDKKATAGKTYQYKIYASVTKSSTTYKSAYSSVKKMVRLKAVSISSVKNSASKKMTVKWSKNTKATGYQIQYSTSSSFASSKTKTVTISKAATVSRTIGSLTKGKTYYVRVRAYKKVSSTKYYSAWSSKKSVKISK